MSGINGEGYAMDYLVAFEYGSGTVWGYVTADSEQHIETELPEVDVYDSPPAWMTVDEVASLRTEAIPVGTEHAIDALLDIRRIQGAA